MNKSKNVAPLEYHLHELTLATGSRAGRCIPDVPDGCTRVLDVGCGVGQTLLELALPPNAEAVGVDVDADAIAVGRARFPHLDLQVAGGESLPFPSAHFDLVYSRVSLPYMHVPRALREFARVLKPGGTLWLSVHPPGMFWTDVRQAVASKSLRSLVYRGYVLANSVLIGIGVQLRYPLSTTRIESYQIGAVMRRALRAAGFTDIRQWREPPCTIVSARMPTV